MLGTGLVVVHDTLVGGEDEHAELTGGQHSESYPHSLLSFWS